MTDIHIVRDYPHPPAKVWHAVTDPELIPLWTATGQGARPVGFAPVRGTRFRFVAKPYPGWRGIVDCEVLEARSAPLSSKSSRTAGRPMVSIFLRTEPSSLAMRNPPGPVKPVWS